MENGNDPLQRLWAVLPLLTLFAAAMWFGRQLPAWGYMWALAFAIFFGTKWLTLWQARDSAAHRFARSAGYLLLWPGMDARSFLVSVNPPKPEMTRWCWALLKTAIGVALLWGCARRVPPSMLLLRGWVGLLGLVFLLHFGSFEMLALGWQALGVDAQPIMQRPVSSTSLTEFWGRRWNLGFRQLSHEFVFKPFQELVGVKNATLLVFLCSGLIHELVISVPAHGGYGLPTGYFLVQAAGVLVERSRAGRGLGLSRGFAGWAFTAVIAAGPAFWLFHPPFILRVAVPFMEAIRAL